ncbi:MAG: D-alpha,beta-D-heptose 7-phosphate 1-kinase [Schlesneria sp.]|nr:D-alpha,beta-D-heptose 7-phosphate 1-kinase [Schlesneria sp.]
MNVRAKPSSIDFGHPRLLVVGDLMLDRYVWGDAERISPEAPVLVLRENLDEVRPGGAANVASFLKGLEAEVVLAGVVGDDAEGRILKNLMGVISGEITAVMTDDSRQTTTKQRFVGRAAQRQPHQILRVDRETRTPLSQEIEGRLIDAVLSAIPTCDAVLISDYAKGVCTPTLLRAVIDRAREFGKPVLIDPSRGGDYQRYARATLITPNRSAAELVVGLALRDQATIEQVTRELRKELQLDAAVVTLDCDGLAYATSEDQGIVPCRPREVCDVTGAGDMVLAILGLCFAANVPLIESLQLANAAAGLEVERFGVEPITRSELIRGLDRDQGISQGPVSLDELMVHVDRHRRAGRSIVFTNGCFDLLHVGHVSLLEEAARLGDVLIVAINSDASVHRLKGAERPIIGERDRARMLAALGCVDHVLVFDDDTPHRLLEAIRPEVLVKGGTTGHIVGAEIVAAYGGLVTRTASVPELSTTNIVQRLQANPVFPS